MTDLDIWAENNIELPIKRALENLKVYMEGKSIIDTEKLEFLFDGYQELLDYFLKGTMRKPNISLEWSDKELKALKEVYDL